MNREELISEIYKISTDIVIVGGTSQFYQGKKEKAKDIDIVVKNLGFGFRALGKIHCWITTSPFSISGKRAFIRRPDFNIDIFIEHELPEHIETEHGFKIETIDSMINFYKRVYVDYDENKRWKQKKIIKQKHDAISSHPL